MNRVGDYNYESVQELEPEIDHYETEFAEIKLFATAIFVRVWREVPGVDLIFADYNLVDVFYFCYFFVFLFFVLFFNL